MHARSSRRTSRRTHIAALLVAVGLVSPPVGVASAEPESPAAATPPVKHQFDLSTPGYPEVVVTSGSRFTRVAHTKAGVVGAEYGIGPFSDKTQLTDITTYQGEQRFTGPASQIAVGDMDNDGSDEVAVVAAGQKLVVTNSQRFGFTKRYTYDLWTIPGFSFRGMGFIEGPDVDESLLFVADPRGIHFFRTPFPGETVLRHTGTYAPPQEVLHAVHVGKHNREVLRPAQPPGNVFWAMLKAGERSMQPVKYTHDFSTGTLNVLDWGSPWPTPWDIGSVVLSYDEAIGGATLPAALVTNKFDSRESMVFTTPGDGHVFCKSNDFRDAPSFEYKLFDKENNSGGVTSVRACATSEAGGPTGAQVSVHVESSNPHASAYKIVTIPLPSGVQPLRAPQVVVDFPCPWLLLSGGPSGCSAGTRPVNGPPGRVMVTVAGYSTNIADLSKSKAFVGVAAFAPFPTDAPAFQGEFSWWRQLPAPGRDCCVLMAPLGRKDNVVTVKLNSLKPVSHEGAPIPVAILAAPPQVGGAGQEPLNAPVFAQGSGTSTSSSTTKSETIGASMQVKGKFAGTGLGVEGAFEQSEDQAIARGKSYSVDEVFIGTLEDDVVVYTAMRMWRWDGKILASSIGQGVGTSTSLYLPRDVVTSSSRLSRLQGLYPKVYGASRHDPKGILSGIVEHDVGNPGSYMKWGANGAAVSDHCIGDVSGTKIEPEFPTPDLNPNPFLQVNSAPDRYSGPDILFSAKHQVVAGSDNSEGARFAIDNSTGETRASQRAVSVTASIETILSEHTATYGQSVGVEWSGELSDGVSFEAYVGHFPSDQLDEEQYDWRMFLCKRKAGDGNPVWVLGYTVDDYTGSGGLEPLGDVTLRSPIHSAKTTATPRLVWSQPSGTVAKYDLEVEAIGFEDYRSLRGVRTWADTVAAKKRPDTTVLEWSSTQQPQLKLNKTYRWRVKSTDFFENLKTSEWEYLVTAPSHALTVQRTGTGSVVSSPAGVSCGGDCSQSYVQETKVTLSARPAAGWALGGWRGACTGMAATCTVAMSAAKTVAADFVTAPAHGLAVQRFGGGTVISSPAGVRCGADCAQRFPHGTSVTLTAKPQADWVFGGWTGRCVGTATTCTVPMSEAKTVRADFVRKPGRVLTIDRTGPGQVTSSPVGLACGVDCVQRFAEGAKVTLTARPNAGAKFVGWNGGGCTGTATKCVVTMDLAKTVNATFRTS